MILELIAYENNDKKMYINKEMFVNEMILIVRLYADECTQLLLPSRKYPGKQSQRYVALQ